MQLGTPLESSRKLHEGCFGSANWLAAWKPSWLANAWLLFFLKLMFVLSFSWLYLPRLGLPQNLSRSHWRHSLFLRWKEWLIMASSQVWDNVFSNSFSHEREQPIWLLFCCFQGSIVMCNLFVCQLLGVQRTRSNKSWMARFVHLVMSNIKFFWLASRKRVNAGAAIFYLSCFS